MIRVEENNHFKKKSTSLRPMITMTFRHPSVVLWGQQTQKKCVKDYLPCILADLNWLLSIAGRLEKEDLKETGHFPNMLFYLR